jgi:hypothetical protein
MGSAPPHRNRKDARATALAEQGTAFKKQRTGLLEGDAGLGEP